MINKIIHISLGKANPNRMNGVNKVLHSLLSAQSEIVSEVEFWGISFSKKHNYPVRPFNTRLYSDTRLKFKLDSKLKLAISKLTEDENVIVHLHGAFLPQLFSVSRLLVANNIPYIFTPHGGYNIRALQKSKLMKRAYMKTIEGYIVKNAKSVQLIGASEAEGLIRFMKPRHFKIIPNGQVSASKNLTKIPKKENGLNIGYLGRIDIQTKGLDILLKALVLVKEEVIIKLSVIGKGGEMKKLKSEVQKLQLSRQVEFKGALFGDEKLEALAQLDAFFLVSRNEGLPGVVLEAAAVGVPSVVSVQTNLSEYIKKANAGWVMSEYNENELARIIVEIRNDKANHLIDIKGKNAAEMIRNVFCWKEIAESLNLLYAA
ncbi:MAG: glycosyltransferase involved in cell wall biosynthesis [Arenicella sp.]|jgi:glycosyltransferase involved in cell wall biosynthesis